MNPLVVEWIEKAEGDYATARRESVADPRPNYDAACYRAQQAIEKLMKALLIANGAVPHRTHNMVFLDEMLRDVCPEWTCAIRDLRLLSLASMHFRYPGASAERIDALETLAAFDRRFVAFSALILAESASCKPSYECDQTGSALRIQSDCSHPPPAGVVNDPGSAARSYESAPR